LGSAVEEIGAKRVVLDTIEVLFSALGNESSIRGELFRLFRWLKDKGLTAIVTAERGEGKLTRYGLEEYVADCVILLDHRLSEQVSTRRLRILKYRGSLHEMDEHPFLMGDGGISVLPLTSAGLSHAVSGERISSGVSDLDRMLGGKGFFRGSSILVSGTAGTGKSSLAFSFLKAACERGESATYFGFEESSAQSMRNMKSIGIDLRPLVDRGLLHFNTLRPSSLGLEAHLAAIHQAIRRYKPKVVVLDPISVFMSIAERDPVKSMLTRLVDFLKVQQITTLFTHLSSDGGRLETMEQRVSSIMDTWLSLRDEEYKGRRRAMMYVLKSRGMAHSREVVEFVLTNKGIHLGANAARKRAIERA
jgi:circadian clock protein KaiC